MQIKRQINNINMLTILSMATLYQRTNMLGCWNLTLNNYIKGECNASQGPNNSQGSTKLCATSRPQPSAHNSPRHQHREQKLREKTRGGKECEEGGVRHESSPRLPPIASLPLPPCSVSAMASSLLLLLFLSATAAAGM